MQTVQDDVGNVTGELLQFFVNCRRQVVDTNAFVAAASRYDVTAYERHF